MREVPLYRGTTLIRDCFLLGPYSRTMPRAVRWSEFGNQIGYEEGPAKATVEQHVAGLKAPPQFCTLHPAP